MIFGIGVDIVEIERVEKACKNTKFINKVFTQNEIEFFNSKIQKKSSQAGNFAAKEAISKALGNGFNGISPKDIEILRYKNGMPYVNLFGGAKKICDELLINKIHISISHSNKDAVAYAVAEIL